MKKDYCTWFKESWRGVDISECCKGHDTDCGSHGFYNCLKGKIGKFHASYIALGGGLGCWAKYTSKMFRRLF